MLRWAPNSTSHAVRSRTDINESRRKIQLKYTQAVLGTKEVSEVFMLAVDGLTQDLPAPKVLRRRLECRS
jgi:hypothetical protein